MGGAVAVAGCGRPKYRAKNSSSQAKNACLSSSERFAQSIPSKSTTPLLGPPDAFFEDDGTLRGGGGGGGFAFVVLVPEVPWVESRSRAELYDLILALFA